MVTKKSRKKTYEIILVMMIARCAIIITRASFKNSICKVGGKRWVERVACEKGGGWGLEGILCIITRVPSETCRIVRFGWVRKSFLSDAYGGGERLWGGERVGMGCEWVQEGLGYVRIGCGRGCGGFVFTRVWVIHSGDGGVKRRWDAGGWRVWGVGWGGGVISWRAMGWGGVLRA